MISSQMIKHGQTLSGMIMKKRYFTATEAATALGISKQTLLRYEARNIFPKAPRNRLNGWREYTESDIQALQKLMGRDR